MPRRFLSVTAVVLALAAGTTYAATRGLPLGPASAAKTRAFKGYYDLITRDSVVYMDDLGTNSVETETIPEGMEALVAEHRHGASQVRVLDCRPAAGGAEQPRAA